jgi:RNA polymerase sigma-70 factor (ECF subfamily)
MTHDFDALYRENVDAIYRYLYRRTLTRMTAEDLTSQTFLKALEKIDSFDPAKGRFGGWVMTIAKNVLTDHFRALKPQTDIDDVWDLSSDDDVAGSLEDKEAHAELRDALAKLPKDKREIVLLRMWEDLSYAEIAAVTGKSEGNCKVIFSRAMKDLRALVPLSTLLLILFPPLP